MSSQDSHSGGLTFAREFCTSVQRDYGRGRLDARFVPQEKHHAKDCPEGSKQQGDDKHADAPWGQ